MANPRKQPNRDIAQLYGQDGSPRALQLAQQQGTRVPRLRATVRGTHVPTVK